MNNIHFGKIVEVELRFACGRRILAKNFINDPQALYESSSDSMRSVTYDRSIFARNYAHLKINRLEFDTHSQDFLTIVAPEEPMNNKELRTAFVEGANFRHWNYKYSADRAEEAAHAEAKKRYPAERKRRVIQVDQWFYTVKDGTLYFGIQDYGENFNAWWNAKLGSHVNYDGSKLTAFKPMLHHLGPIAELIQNPTEEAE